MEFQPWIKQTKQEGAKGSGFYMRSDFVFKESRGYCDLVEEQGPDMNDLLMLI